MRVLGERVISKALSNRSTKVAVRLTNPRLGSSYDRDGGSNSPEMSKVLD